MINTRKPQSIAKMPQPNAASLPRALSFGRIVSHVFTSLSTGKRDYLHRDCLMSFNQSLSINVAFAVPPPSQMACSP